MDPSRTSNLRGWDRPKESLAAALQAIDADMSAPEPWQRAGALLIAHKKWDEARRLLALALTAIPADAVLRSYYALALAKSGDLEAGWIEAMAALRLQPGLGPALLAKTEILCEAGYYDLALQESASIEEQNTAAFSLGSLSFITGEYARGIRLLTTVINSGWRGRDLPEWDGVPTSSHIVLYGGQGFGDMAQFTRYIPFAESRAGKISLHVTRNMARLMRTSFPHLSITAGEDETGGELIPLPRDVFIGAPEDAALRCSFPSLAKFTDDGFDPFADKVPYLRADSQLTMSWRDRLAHIPHPRIGLTWAGTWFSNNPYRSIPFEALQPLIDIAGSHLVSLQRGPESQRAADAGLFNAAPNIQDFADTAALLNEIDLLITLDSAPAHLAGAMGRPVWTLLPFDADWRWLIAREDSIWYPTMRLFRQDYPGNWPGVIEQVGAEIGRFLAGDRDVLKSPLWPGPALRRHPHALPLPGLDVEST